MTEREISDLAFAHGENRVQSFVIKPLFSVFLGAALASAFLEYWWTAVGFLCLMLYVGSIGARLLLHKGKTFTDLSREITPKLPPCTEDEYEGGLSDDQALELVRVTTRTTWAIAFGVAVLILTLGLQVYWAILAGLLVRWLSTPFVHLFVMSVALPTVRRRMVGR
jgi:hypothetical protein